MTPASSGGASAQRRSPGQRRRRDRHGRGLRGDIAPRSVPLHKTRSESFDDVVLEAVDHLDSHWPGDLDGLDFAVDDVPNYRSATEYDSDAVVDRGITLGRLLRAGAPIAPRRGAAVAHRPTVVLFRRPIEARSEAGDERSALVFAVVAELVGQLTGRDPGQIHPE